MGAIPRIILPRDLTTGMKQWRFKGAKLQTVPFQDYLVAGAGPAAAGAGAALPAVAEGAGVTFAAACGWALGLIQQAWTRSSRLFGTLSSI
jgi:hypothetical protein